MRTARHPFLGFSAPATTFGLGRAVNGHTAKPVLHEGKAHCLSIGQTGSGKTNLMIGNLLLWEGSAIVVDVRGDAMRATARWRREVLGQKVYILEPFAKGGSPDRLDPLDLITLPETDVDTESQTIATVLATPLKFDGDAYWHTEGGAVIGGLAAHLMVQKTRSMKQLISLLFQEEFDLRLAEMLDEEVIPKGSYAYESMVAYLDIPDGNNGATRSCVRSIARSMVEPFRSRAVQSAMGPSTVDLNLLLRGEPMTLYLVLPIERIVSHAMVLGLWIEILCQTLLRRTEFPKIPTLLFVDECAQFGCVSTALKMISVFMRGQAVKLWSFFQDYGQIKTMFGNDVSTFVNSNSAITLLPGTGMAARELAATLGVSERQVEGLADDEQVVYEVGKGSQTVKMAKYWEHPLFKGRFDPLPRFKTTSGFAARNGSGRRHSAQRSSSDARRRSTGAGDGVDRGECPVEFVPNGR